MLPKIVLEEEHTDKRRGLIQRNKFYRVLSHGEKKQILMSFLLL